MVSEDSTFTVLLRARCLLLLQLLAADSREWLRCALCGITFKITCNMERKHENDFVPIRTRKNPAASKTRPHQKVFFLYMETPYMDLRAGPTRKVIRRTSQLCNPQNTHAPPRRDRGCQNTCLYIPFAYVYCSGLSRKQWQLALSKLEKIFEV